ncbi:hypothetical protein ACWDYJ_11400 [Streptomyces sp. NPDC003042]
MKIPVTIHRPRLGPQEFRVIRPARPPEHAVLVDGDWGLNACLDQAGAQLIAGLWALAASSPRSLIHLPLRRAAARGGGPRELDLVLLHHSLQFPPSRWKELRARLGPGRPETVTVLPPTTEPEIDHAAQYHAENRDLFHQRVHAETLFMTGSAKVFRETAGLFRDIAQHGPGHGRSLSPHGHYCARLDSGDAGAREIHIEYSDQWDA